MKSTAFLLAFYYLFSFKLKADETPIIVTADRLQSEKSLSTSQIVLIQEEEIKNHSSLSSLFQKHSEIILLSSGPSGSNSSLFLRGNDSSHVLVIIDGIIVNDPSNPSRQFDFGKLSLSSIEKIEILKGSQGVLYGSNAIGGAIIITTKKTGKNHARASFDTFKKRQIETFFNKSFDGINASIMFDHLRTEGYSAAHDKLLSLPDKDGERRSTIQTHLSAKLTEELSSDFSFRFVDDFTELDKGGGNSSDDPNDYQTQNEKHARIALKRKSEHSESSLGYSFSENKRSSFVLNDQTYQISSLSKNKGTLHQVNFNHNYNLTSLLEQSIALDYQHEKDLLKNDNYNTSLALYHLLDFFNGGLNFGARLDKNHIFNEHLTYKVAINQKWHEQIWRASFSTGFRAPSLNQLFDPTYGNRNLTPEKSQSAEIGPELNLSQNSHLKFTLFWTEVKNKLSYNPVTFVNINQGIQRIYGTEIGYDFFHDLTGRFNLSSTFLRTKDIKTREKLTRRPAIASNLSHTYNFDKIQLRHEIKYVGTRNDVDNNGFKVTNSSFKIYSIEFNYQSTSTLKTYLRLNNLFNERYEEIYGYNSAQRNAEFAV